MPAVMEQIKHMSVAEKMQTMELLWSSLATSAGFEPPSWHADVLAVRRRRVENGEETFMTLEESKRRLQEAVHAR